MIDDLMAAFYAAILIALGIFVRWEFKRLGH